MEDYGRRYTKLFSKTAVVNLVCYEGFHQPRKDHVLVKKEADKPLLSDSAIGKYSAIGG